MNRNPALQNGASSSTLSFTAIAFTPPNTTTPRNAASVSRSGAAGLVNGVAVIASPPWLRPHGDQGRSFDSTAEPREGMR